MCSINYLCFASKNTETQSAYVLCILDALEGLDMKWLDQTIKAGTEQNHSKQSFFSRENVKPTQRYSNKNKPNGSGIGMNRGKADGDKDLA